MLPLAKKFAVLAAVVFTLTIFPFAETRAQSDSVRAARLDVLESIERLAEVKELNLTAKERERQELRFKKDALQKIIILSARETQDLRDKLPPTSDVDALLLPLRDVFRKDLDAYLGYFTTMGGVAEKAENIDEVQKIAGLFREWRDVIYNQEITRVVEFILVYQNKSVLKTADQRLTKIANELAKIKSLKIGAPQALLKQSVLELEEAHALNNRALALLSAYLPKIGSEPQKEWAEEENPEPIGGDDKNDMLMPETDAYEPSIRELVGQSLNKLRITYANFIELTQLIKKAGR